MPTTQQQREKLIGLLKQLFQLDQPELDFGFYRIMHAKAKEVIRFLEDDLLKVMADAFGELSGQPVQERLNKARGQVEEVLGASALNDDGTLDDMFKATPVGKEYISAFEMARAAADTKTAEGEVYDHLYRFFERYYEGGDFISKRYLTRETSRRAAPYAVPYNGEEVKLHWANSDQYYIKTAEYFTNYTFKLRPENAESPLPVTFKIVDATEGEHGNVKASNGQKRYFILHSEDPVGLESGELVVRFEYRPDPEKTGQDGVWQGKRNEAAETAILAALEAQEETREYFEALRQPAPINTQKDRTLLGRYVAKYSARNTMDYFIHKNLGDFLRRELDYYIKNEVMRLDDIESADAPRVEQYLSKIKVLRKIASKLIDFLAQLEDFQKKLWLKKKFVVDTQYCITLGCVPEEFYEEIAANDAQREEWVQLFAIDSIERNTIQPGYTVPLLPDFLKAHPTLVLDTRHFTPDFIERFVAATRDFEETVDGVMFHSENFQALSLMQARYRDQVKCVYIDPPYNTGEDDFPYKDSYQHSSWMCMMHDRALMSQVLLAPDGLFSVQIGDGEMASVRMVFDACFAERKNSAVVRRGIKNVQAQFEDIDRLSLGHDVVHSYTKHSGVRLAHLRQALADEKPGKWDTFWRGTDRPTMRYELFGQNPSTGQWRWEQGRAKRACQNYTNFLKNEAANKSLDEWYAENVQCSVDLDFVRMNDGGVVQYYVPPQNFRLVSDNWLDIPASGNLTAFAHEKSLSLLQRVISWSTRPGDYVLDYFGGSGSTGHAAFSMPPSGDGKRRFILVEMGHYFDTELLPRIKRFAFAPEWKDGKPKRLATVEETERTPRIMKVIRLESYEDTLNNLEFKDDDARLQLLEHSSGLREDFMLHYMLDVETSGSQSLLNVDAFADPTAYKLKVKKPGSDEYDVRRVDLLETFNYLIGLRVDHISAPQSFTATFKREPDPELPADSNTKLIVDGRIKQDASGPWWFRKVEGWTTDGNGGREKALIVWRKLTGDLEQDNLMLDEWFKSNCISAQDFEYDTIYVNGSNNLPNLKREQDNWKVRLIEEDFFRLMWDVEDV